MPAPVSRDGAGRISRGHGPHDQADEGHESRRRDPCTETDRGGLVGINERVRPRGDRRAAHQEVCTQDRRGSPIDDKPPADVPNIRQDDDSGPPQAGVEHSPRRAVVSHRHRVGLFDGGSRQKGGQCLWVLRLDIGRGAQVERPVSRAGTESAGPRTATDREGFRERRAAKRRSGRIKRASWTTQARGNVALFRRTCTSLVSSQCSRSRRWSGPASAAGLRVDQLGPVQERGVPAVLARPVAGVIGQDEIAGPPQIERSPRMVEHPTAGLSRSG